MIGIDTPVGSFSPVVTELFESKCSPTDEPISDSTLIGKSFTELSPIAP